MTTDVVIVAFNSGEWLTRAVASALCAHGVDKVWVVDNGSPDATVASLGQARVQHLQNAQNLGFATAANIGWRASSAEQILFLNPDCELAPSDVHTLSQILTQHRDAGIVSAQLLNSDGSLQQASLRFDPTPKRAIFEALGWRRRGIHQSAPAQPMRVEVEACSGALMLIPRAVLEQSQGFDEGYFLHCEDLDLCRRIRGLGYRVLVDTGVRVMHAKGTSSTAVAQLVIDAKYRGMLRYFEKFDRAQTSHWLRVLVYAGAWLRHRVALWRAH